MKYVKHLIKEVKIIKYYKHIEVYHKIDNHSLVNMSSMNVQIKQKKNTCITKNNNNMNDYDQYYLNIIKRNGGL